MLFSCGAFYCVALRHKRCSCHFFSGFPGKCKPSSAKGSRSEASSGTRHLFRKKLVRFLRKLMVKNSTDAIFYQVPSDSCRACSAKTHPGTFGWLASTNKLLPIAQKKAIRVFFLGLQNRKQFCMR